MATYQSKREYVYGTGRRKASVARVHLFQGGSGKIVINGRDIDDYFGLETLKRIVRQPLSPPRLSARLTSTQQSRAAAFPVRPALFATAFPELCSSWTRTIGLC